MDLEHTSLGVQCAVGDCHQNDFLPFKCDICHQKYCLMHRTYEAHSCQAGGSKAKDYTSIDCPLCGESVKFTKSSSVDEVWDEHYIISCKQNMKPLRVKETCCRTDCNTLLGLSNFFTCPKCRGKACLSHRNPEDHACVGVRGVNATAPGRQQSNKAATNKKLSYPSQAPSSVQLIKPSATPYVKSARRSIYTCPFCDYDCSSPDRLVQHVQETHPEPTSTFAPVGTSLPQPLVENECPQCGQNFASAVDLVVHCESAHSHNDNIARRSSNIGSLSGGSDCVIG